MTEDAPAHATTPKPAIAIIGTGGSNIWHGMGQPKAAIVAHIMQGSLAACDAWFQNPAAKASANYGIGKDGTIHQYVDPEGPDAPFANGLVQNPATTVQALQANHPDNPNWWTVSIEHEGLSGDPMPQAQLEASATLAAWLIQRFGIPNDENHLLGHYEFDSLTRAACPGWDRAGWLNWEEAINRHLEPPTEPTPAPAPQPPAPDQLTALEQQLAEARAQLVAAAAKLLQIKQIASS